MARVQKYEDKITLNITNTDNHKMSEDENKHLTLGTTRSVRAENESGSQQKDQEDLPENNSLPQYNKGCKQTAAVNSTAIQPCKRMQSHSTIFKDAILSEAMKRMPDFDPTLLQNWINLVQERSKTSKGKARCTAQIVFDKYKQMQLRTYIHLWRKSRTRVTGPKTRASHDGKNVCQQSEDCNDQTSIKTENNTSLHPKSTKNGSQNFLTEIKQRKERLVQQVAEGSFPGFNPEIKENWIKLVQEQYKFRNKKMIGNRARDLKRLYFRRHSPKTNVNAVPKNLKASETVESKNASDPNAVTIERILQQIDEGIPGFDPEVNEHWMKLVRENYSTSTQKTVRNATRTIKKMYIEKRGSMGFKSTPNEELLMKYTELDGNKKTSEDNQSMVHNCLPTIEEQVESKTISEVSTASTEERKVPTEINGQLLQQDHQDKNSELDRNETTTEGEQSMDYHCLETVEKQIESNNVPVVKRPKKIGRKDKILQLVEEGIPGFNPLINKQWKELVVEHCGNTTKKTIRNVTKGAKVKYFRKYGLTINQYSQQVKETEPDPNETTTEVNQSMNCHCTETVEEKSKNVPVDKPKKVGVHVLEERIPCRIEEGIPGFNPVPSSSIDKNNSTIPQVTNAIGNSGLSDSVDSIKTENNTSTHPKTTKGRSQQRQNVPFLKEIKDRKERLVQQVAEGSFPGFNPEIKEHWIKLVQEKYQFRDNRIIRNRVRSLKRLYFRRYGPITNANVVKKNPKASETVESKNASDPNAVAFEKILQQIDEGIPGFNPEVNEHWTKLVREHYSTSTQQTVRNTTRTIKKMYIEKYGSICFKPTPNADLQLKYLIEPDGNNKMTEDNQSKIHSYSQTVESQTIVVIGTSTNERKVPSESNNVPVIMSPKTKISRRKDTILQLVEEGIPGFNPLINKHWKKLAGDHCKSSNETINNLAKTVKDMYFRKYGLTVKKPTTNQYSQQVPVRFPGERSLCRIEGIPDIDPTISKHWTKLVKEHYPSKCQKAVANSAKHRYQYVRNKKIGVESNKSNPKRKTVMLFTTPKQEKILQLARERLPEFIPMNGRCWYNLTKEVYPMVPGKKDIYDISQRMKKRFFREQLLHHEIGNSSTSTLNNETDNLTSKVHENSSNLTQVNAHKRKISDSFCTDTTAPDNKTRKTCTTSFQENFQFDEGNLMSHTDSAKLHPDLPQAKCTSDIAMGSDSRNKSVPCFSKTCFSSPSEERILQMVAEREPCFDAHNLQCWLQLMREIYPFGEEKDNRVMALKMQHYYFRHTSPSFFHDLNKSIAPVAETTKNPIPENKTDKNVITEILIETDDLPIALEEEIDGGSNVQHKNGWNCAESESLEEGEGYQWSFDLPAHMYEMKNPSDVEHINFQL